MANELAQLRTDYEAALGKKPSPSWDAAELQKRMAAAAAPDEKPVPTPRPVPSQNKADEIRENATAAEPARKAKDQPTTSDDPLPTQADLDAMRAGTFDRYKTR